MSFDHPDPYVNPTFTSGVTTLRGSASYEEERWCGAYTAVLFLTFALVGVVTGVVLFALAQ